MNFVFKDNKIFIVDSSLKDIFGGDHFEFKKYLGKEVGGGSCLGTHVHPWWIHVNVWQNQKKKKIKKEKKKKNNHD